MWDLLGTCTTTGNSKDFSAATHIWLKRPNVCSKIISCSTLQETSFTGDAFLNIQYGNIVTAEIMSLVRKLQELTVLCAYCKKEILPCKLSDGQLHYFVRKLVPHRHDCYESGYEFVIETTKCYIFVPIDSSLWMSAEPIIIYMLCYNVCGSCYDIKVSVSHNQSKIFGSISAYAFRNEDFLQSLDMKYNLLSETSNDANYELFGKSKLKCFADRKWVLEILLPKIAKWCSEEQNQTESLFVPSLSLINREKYSVLYHNLKKKYGKDISAAWPEVTDPQKYVYEDIAIASYLLLLWEEERTSAGIKKMQSFADLGCGNGLLVHILISEGHQGIGIDIRKRKVWNIYDAKTKLVEGIVDPNDLSIVKQYDWLLGNHSDELTPWIPVMASKCGYNTKFWVLPCCFFDFYGKYERMQSSSGQYIDYLKFVKSIGFQCGFDIKEDVMRIPSTKRVCFVGKSKTYKEFEHESTIKAIDKFINERKDSLASNKFAKGFQARPKEEKVRNCTKISREIQFSIVKSISSHLLSEYNPIMSDSGKPWNRGGKLVLGKAIEILSESSRLQLKKECGGLQTFLRNNHQIFEVRSGAVQIRDWTTPEQHPISKKRKKGNKADTWKTKDCWFHNNHPDGCPRSSDACPFLHQ